AGSELLSDPVAFSMLLKGLQPNKMRALIGQGGQSPRAVVVCVETERMSGGSQALAALARNLRVRLGEVAESFGAQFPGCVLFTKSDRIPFFSDFVRNLTNQEAIQALGAELAMSGPVSGVYAEQQAARVDSAFDSVFHALSNARPEILAREHDASKLP